MQHNGKILLIYTGGTIGMMKDATGVLRPFPFDSIKERIPELALLDCEIQTVSFRTPIDSSDMNPAHWGEIAQIIKEYYADFDGFVVLHGSDTMSYSASALSFMLQNLTKPVIFTGSQLPIGDLRTDARENLITSIQLASLKENETAVIQEVGLYFEYKLYRGNRSTKISAEHFNAFASMNYPTLAESGVHLKVFKENLLRKTPVGNFDIFTDFDTNVILLPIFPGIQEDSLQKIFQIKGLKAVILQTFGSGNAPTAPWFLNLLEKSIAQGLIIINVTQCKGGSVIPGKYENGSHFERMGVVNGKNLTSEAALTKAMFLLGKNSEANSFKINFEQDLQGEMK